MGTRRVKRNRNRFRIVVIISLLLLLALLGAGLFFVLHKPEKKAHISIDDATLIFQNIYWEEYDSIFENEILGKLQELHEQYGIKVTLYVFEELEEFAIWDMPLEYKKEFRENADWLQIGFHSIADSAPETWEKDFEEEYSKTESAIIRFAGEKSVAKVLRLHYWYATDEMVACLQEAGVTGLLCSDSGVPSYNLTEEQAEKLYSSRDGVLETDGMTYYATDIRLEDTKDITVALEERKKDRFIVIFTHAWCFEENCDKLEEAAAWLAEAEYQFTNLEETEE